MNAAETAGPGIGARYPSLAYVAPFAVFLGFLALGRRLPLGAEVLYPIRVLAVSAVVVIFSRSVIDFRVKNALGSVLLGVAVFLLWIGPDVLWPAYRSHWLFTNSIMGEATSTAPDSLKTNLLFIVFRVMGCVLLVPVVEELFWRGWLARWIIDSEDFRRPPLGAYTALSFWAGSLLFASEHGPYWEVGLIAGVAYNWWMCRTKSLADCILAHAVTNGCLSAYVLTTGEWRYWL
jgi:CAAX prenyl protease-like protein